MHLSAAGQEPQFMIYQRQPAGLTRAFGHASRFFGIHSHWLFAQHRLALRKRGERHFTVREYRRHHTHQIDVIASNQGAPVTFDVGNVKFASDHGGMFAMRTANRHDARVFTVFESGNLRGARKAGPNDANANFLCDR